MNLKRAISLAVSITLLLIIYSKINIYNLAKVFANSNIFWMAISLGMVITITIATSWRLQLRSVLHLRKLAKSIPYADFGMLLNFLDYKLGREGGKLATNTDGQSEFQAWVETVRLVGTCTQKRVSVNQESPVTASA